MKRTAETGTSPSSGMSDIPAPNGPSDLDPVHQDSQQQELTSLPRQCKQCHLLPAIDGGRGCHAFHNCGGRIGRRIASSTFRIDSIVDRPQQPRT